MFKRDLPEAVSHPACSIFDKKLLFIAGGMSKGEWISTIQIFDIEKCAMYPIKDKKLENFGQPLAAPSMSAEYFDRLGLIICGQNLETGETEIRIFSSKKIDWKTYNIDHHYITNFSFIGLKLFSASPTSPIYMLTLGGMDFTST